MDEQLHHRVAHLEQLIVSRVSSYQNSSVQFATVLVANLMIINSGALFAFSSMVERSNLSTHSDAAFYAALCFVGGIFLATACGYSAYHNFMALAQNEAIEGHEGVFDEKHPGLQQGLPEVDSWRKKVQEDKKYYDRVVNVSLWTGNITGILSLFAFILGCYFVGRVAFS